MLKQYIKHNKILFLEILIVLSFTILEVLYFYHHPIIDHDEIIGINIGMQPWEMFFKTISTEPHPIGYFLILKALSLFEISTIRSLLAISGNLIIIISLVIGNHYKTWDKNKLSAGVLLFLSSFVYLHSTTRIKPDTLSLPLFILFITLYLIYKELKLKRSGILNWMALVTIAIMMLNLRTFVFVGIVWGYEIISLIKVQGLKSLELRRILIRMILVSSIMVIYMGLFGAQQFVNNKFRMSWINPSENKLSNNIIIDIFPYAKFYLRIIGYSEFLYVFLIVIILREIKLTKDSRESGINKDILYITIISIVSGYVTKSFIEQPRYAAPAIFLILLLLSKYLSKIDLRIFVVMVLVNVFLATRGFIYYTSMIENNYGYLVKTLSKFSELEDTPMVWITDAYPAAAVYLSHLSSHSSISRLDNITTVNESVGKGGLRYINYNVLEMNKNAHGYYWNRWGKYKFLVYLETMFTSGVNRVLYTTTNDPGVINLRADIFDYLGSVCTLKYLEDEYGLTGMSVYFTNCLGNVSSEKPDYSLLN